MRGNTNNQWVWTSYNTIYMLYSCPGLVLESLSLVGNETPTLSELASQ